MNAVGKCAHSFNRISKSCLFYSICTSLSIAIYQERTTLINFSVPLTAASDSVRRGRGFGEWEWWAAWSVRLLTALIAATHSLYVIKAKSGTVERIFFLPLLFLLGYKKVSFFNRLSTCPLHCCTLRVRCGTLLYMTPVVLVQAGRSNVWPSPAPY